jgi:hypothetical protein
VSQEINLDQETQEDIKSSTSDLSVPDLEVKTQEMIADELKDLKYKNYLINFKDRVKQWKFAHTDKSGSCPEIPLYWDSEMKEWVWLNRASRRIR